MAAYRFSSLFHIPCSVGGIAKPYNNHLSSLFGQRLFGSVSASFLDQLKGIVGHENLSVSQAHREQHGRDESYHTCLPPDAVVWPTSVEMASKVVKICDYYNIPMIPFGTGTGLEGGITATKGGVCIDLTKMNKVVSLEPEDFTVTVQPGVTRKALNSYLKTSGLWFPIDPGADASVCGMVSTCASGTNAVRYGTMRQNVLNLEIVLPNGDVIHTAGDKGRAKKSSAGYNLTNLFIGSEGSLGLITQATIKLHPQPNYIAAAVCSFPSIREAVDTAIQVIQSGIPIARIELLDEAMVKACNKYSHLTLEPKPTLFFEFHGTSEESLKEQQTSTGDISSGNNGSAFRFAVSPEERNELWTARHNAWYAAVALRAGGRGFATDVCVPISKLDSIIDYAQQQISELHLIAPIVGHVGDGNFHCITVVDPNSKDDIQRAKQLGTNLARKAIELGGTCTGEHGVGIGKRELVQHEVGPAHALMRTIKLAIDPKNLMNPGKVVAV